MNQKTEKLLKLAALEFGVFFAQTAVFFVVAMCTSHFLKDKVLLQKYSDSKISEHIFPELLYTIIGVLLVLGLLSFVSRLGPTNALGRLSAEIEQEVPRTILFFGSTLTGTVLAWAGHEFFYGTVSAFFHALGAALMIATPSFTVGFILKALLKTNARPSEASPLKG